MKLITEKQHIDYQLNGLDGGGDGEDEGENSYGSNDNSELSFDYRPHKVGTEAAATSRNSMEVRIITSNSRKLFVGCLCITSFTAYR